MNMNNATPLPTDRRTFVRAILAGAAVTATALPATVASASAALPLPAMAPPVTVATMIESYRIVRARFHDACDVTDTVRAEQEGRMVLVEDEAEYDAASSEESSALLALCAYRPVTMEEIRERGRYLVELAGELSPDQLDALFASYA
jgi:hypothetical protein